MAVWSHWFAKTISLHHASIVTAFAEAEHCGASLLGLGVVMGHDPSGLFTAQQDS